MNLGKYTGYIIGVILSLLFFIALYMRVKLPYDQIFVGDWVKFAGVDAYSHMRIVDSLAHNFPHLIEFDPYFIYPGGSSVAGPHFFDWLLVAVIWVISLGSPSPHTIDVVSVYFPAVLGALTVIPVYFVGRELFGRWAGLLSAGVMVVLPGEFLGRSVLGFTDHHVAEVLFSTTTLLFLILAIKAAKQRRLSFGNLKNFEWAISAKTIIYSILAGFWLGIYFATWMGAQLFVFIITAYFIVQFVVDHLKHESTDYLCVIDVILFSVVLLVSPPIWQSKMDLAALVAALLIPVALSTISRLLVSKGIKPVYYPLTVAGLALVGMGVFRVVAPSILESILSQFNIFFPSGVAQTTLEVQPLLKPEGNWSLRVAWGNFTTTLFLSIIVLGALIYLLARHGDADKTLLLVWSLVILAAALAQRRFAYYLAANVALLSGYFSWRLLELVGFRKKRVPPVKTSAETRTGKRKPEKRQPAASASFIRYIIPYIKAALAIVAVYFLVFFPNLKPAIATAQWAAFAPSDAWCRLLEWLEKNSPEPAGDSGFYYQRYQKGYRYPESAYGVMSWWDYGYWITRIAHRFPNTNPSQDPLPIKDTANFFLSQYEGLAEPFIWKLDSAYVIIDHTMVTGKLWAIARWAERDQSEFYDVYYSPKDNQLIPVLLYYPTYYRSLAVRMYNFDGKAVVPESTTVISYEERVSRERKRYKHITKAEAFRTWPDAVAYIASQKSGNYRIVSNDPFVSPVPLGVLERYRLVHAEGNVALSAKGNAVPEVKVFEYLGSSKLKR